MRARVLVFVCLLWLTAVVRFLLSVSRLNALGFFTQILPIPFGAVRQPIGAVTQVFSYNVLPVMKSNRILSAFFELAFICLTLLTYLLIRRYNRFAVLACLRSVRNRSRSRAFVCQSVIPLRPLNGGRLHAILPPQFGPTTPALSLWTA